MKAVDLNPKKPVVDDKRIRQVHREIQSMPDIVLDADPLSAGPKALNNKKAAIRNQLTRSTALEIQLMEDLGWFKRELTREEAKYDLEFTSLIANNPHVRAGRSTADREAAAKVMLIERTTKISDLRLAVEDLEMLLKVVRTKQKDLRNLQSQLRDALKICEHEIGLGSVWGKQRVGTYGQQSAVAADTQDMHDLLDEVDAASGDLDAEDDGDEDDEGSEDVEDAEDVIEDAEDALAGSTVSESYDDAEEQVVEVAEDDEKLEAVMPSNASAEEADGFLDDLDASPEKPEVMAAQDIDIDDLLDDLED